MTQDSILSEGRRRLRLTSPWLTDEQFAAWLNAARHRHRGPVTFELTPEGLAAHYDRADSPAPTLGAAIEVPKVIEQPAAPSRGKRARAKTVRALESRLPSRVDLAPVQGIEGAPAGRLGGGR
jgi:hypothetical protein